MTLPSILFLSALAVLPSDRLAMADRLFNRSDYEAARLEYEALAKEPSIDRAQILYRLIMVARAQKDDAKVRELGGRFLSDYPAHEKVVQIRFYRALSGSVEEKKAELKALDRDETPKDIRAGALCVLGSVLSDASCFERSLALDPKGSYAALAKNSYAAFLMKSENPKDRRKAVELFMDLAFGNEPSLAKDSLYAAVYICYTDGRYAESDPLAKRFLKTYPEDSRIKVVRRMLAMSEYRLGKYVAAIEQSTDENDEWMLLVRASSNERLGNREEARKYADLAAQRFPQGECIKMIHLILARLDFADAEKLGDKNRILEAARRSAEFSKSAVDRIRYGWALENAGEIEKAEDEYAAIARDFPESETACDALYRRAMSLLRREKWSLAEVSLAEATAGGKLTKERVSSAAYWRGVCASRLGHTEESVAFLKQALEGPLSLDERREARLILADADFNAGRKTEALAEYAELIKEGALARMSAAKTQAIGRLLSGDDARLCARSLIGNDSAEWRQAGYALLGDCETAATNLTAAAYAYQRCLEEPCTTEVVAHVALVYGTYLVREGNAVEAEKILKRAAELNRDDNEARARAYLGLARAAQLRHDDESARGYATVIVSLFENTKAAEEAKEILK